MLSNLLVGTSYKIFCMEIAFIYDIPTNGITESVPEYLLSTMLTGSMVVLFTSLLYMVTFL